MEGALSVTKNVFVVLMVVADSEKRALVIVHNPPFTSIGANGLLKVSFGYRVYFVFCLHFRLDF